MKAAQVATAPSEPQRGFRIRARQHPAVRGYEPIRVVHLATDHSRAHDTLSEPGLDTVIKP
eukprot:4109743-Pyramimonas_sp.AAC.2